MNDLNFFRHPLYHPLSTFDDRFEHVREKILRDLRSALGPDSAPLLDHVRLTGTYYFAKINEGVPVPAAIQQAENEMAEAFRNWPVLKEKLKERCSRIAAQISKALLLNNIQPRGVMLDLGAGSGGVAKLIKDSYGLRAAYITDVVDYRFQEVREDDQMYWKLFTSPYDVLPFEEMFDLVIVTNVLHHCKEPEAVFSSLRGRVHDGGSIVVIESCVTVTETDLSLYPDSQLIPYQTVYDERGSVLLGNKDYFMLSAEDSVLYAAFCDWFYNRVLVAEEVPVPFNFTHPQRWNELFVRNGFEVQATYLMGFDQPIVLEFHTLHVLRP